MRWWRCGTKSAPFRGNRRGYETQGRTCRPSNRLLQPTGIAERRSVAASGTVWSVGQIASGDAPKRARRALLDERRRGARRLLAERQRDAVGEIGRRKNMR